MKFLKCVAVCSLVLAGVGETASAAPTNKYDLSVKEDSGVVLKHNGDTLQFVPRFTVLTAVQNPKMEMRWAEFPGDRAKPIYNVLTRETGIPSLKN